MGVGAGVGVGDALGVGDTLGVGVGEALGVGVGVGPGDDPGEGVGTGEGDGVGVERPDESDELQADTASSNASTGIEAKAGVLNFTHVCADHCPVMGSPSIEASISS